MAEFTDADLRVSEDIKNRARAGIKVTTDFTALYPPQADTFADTLSKRMDALLQEAFTAGAIMGAKIAADEAAKWLEARIAATELVWVE